MMVYAKSWCEPELHGDSHHDDYLRTTCVLYVTNQTDSDCVSGHRESIV